MLVSLKNHLKTLSKDSQSKFRAQIAERAGRSHVRRLAGPLQNFALVLPEMLAQVQVWSNDPRLPSEFRRMHGYVLTYLYHPEDLVNEEKHGLFGYLDDAYLAGVVYRLTWLKMSVLNSVLLPTSGSLAEQLDGWLDAAREVLPEETRRLNAVVIQLLENRTEGMEAVLASQK
jgi:uncharacterized membrane protein YkvA (DUF1232 family)